MVMYKLIWQWHRFELVIKRLDDKTLWAQTFTYREQLHASIIRPSKYFFEGAKLLQRSAWDRQQPMLRVWEWLPSDSGCILQRGIEVCPQGGELPRPAKRPDANRRKDDGTTEGDDKSHQLKGGIKKSATSLCMLFAPEDGVRRDVHPVQKTRQASYDVSNA
jgi:hypothetical protein